MAITISSVLLFSVEWGCYVLVPTFTNVRYSIILTVFHYSKKLIEITPTQAVNYMYVHITIFFGNENS